MGAPEIVVGFDGSAQGALAFSTALVTFLLVLVPTLLMGCTLPLLVYRRRTDGGKDRATALPIYQRLRRNPNALQTAKEWRTQGQAHLLLRGNFYNRIVYERDEIAELLPLHPDRMTVKRLSSGRRGYEYHPPGGGREALTQEEVFHVMGLSLDGIVGCSVIEYARESIGAAQAQEGFAARFWRQGAEGQVVFSTPANLSAALRLPMCVRALTLISPPATSPRVCARALT